MTDCERWEWWECERWLWLLTSILVMAVNYDCLWWLRTASMKDNSRVITTASVIANIWLSILGSEWCTTINTWPNGAHNSDRMVTLVKGRATVMMTLNDDRVMAVSTWGKYFGKAVNDCEGTQTMMRMMSSGILTGLCQSGIVLFATTSFTLPQLHFWVFAFLAVSTSAKWEHDENRECVETNGTRIIGCCISSKKRKYKK
jgi:hypothetical protein